MAKLSLLFELSCIFLILFPLFSPCLCCPQYQKEALLQFKFLLLGNTSLSRVKHPISESWNLSSDCCQWEQVTCDSKQHVTILNLSSLTSSLSQKSVVTSDVLTPLFHLQTLTSLDISVNDIHGQIPGVGFANLTELVELIMVENSFNGSIPPQFFSLRHLEKLDLGHNLIAGTLGSKLGNLSNLRELRLNDNLFHGQIPKQIGRLGELYLLDLGYNFFSMGIPTEIGNMSSSAYLYLSSNNLSGEIPSSMQKLEHLIELYLENNVLSGKIPPFMFLLKDIYSLVLSGNDFSGLLPDNFTEGYGIGLLALSDNNLSGPIPSPLANGIEYFLDLSGNKFSSFPKFYFYSSLYYINLASNKISGELPMIFPEMTGVLILSQNELFGSLPRELAYLDRLQYLDLHDNNLTGEIPAFFSQFYSLLVLNLRNNSFNGSITIDFSPSSLLIVDLSSNKLSGDIPSTLGNLHRMIDNAYHASDSMGYNFFNGLPEHLLDSQVYWKKLKQNLSSNNLWMYTFLDLSNNQLSGEIPYNLGSLKSLKSLNLSSNKITGGIPVSFGNLQNLEILDLSRNNLSGEIPKNLGKLSELTVLDVSNNKFHGRIPNGPQMDRMNDPNSYVNNSGLCGMQIRIPCGKLPPEQTPIERKQEESKSWKTWFSWEMAVIGYSSGFLSTILVLYVIGYFNIASPWNRRRNFRHNNHFGFRFNNCCS